MPSSFFLMRSDEKTDISGHYRRLAAFIPLRISHLARVYVTRREAAPALTLIADVASARKRRDIASPAKNARSGRTPLAPDRRNGDRGHDRLADRVGAFDRAAHRRGLLLDLVE